MATSLPIVDLRHYPSSQELGAELLRVGKDPGFFYVIGHDLGDDAASRIFQLAHSFFDGPRQDKEAFANGSGDLGYTGMREESLSGTGSGDIKESFYLSNPGDHRQELPTELDTHRDQLAAFYDGCSSLAKRMLEALAVGLDMPEDFLSKAHGGESYRMRLIKYPPVEMTPPPDGDDTPDIRAGAHSDYGSLTLLFRQPSDQGGLQVLLPDASDGEGQWLDVPCMKDAIVVNIGDALEFWTAGRLRSTVHRVAYPRSARENVARLSIPVFIQPDRSVVLEPMATVRGDGDLQARVDQEFAAVLRRKGYLTAVPVTSQEHLASRIRATYRNAPTMG